MADLILNKFVCVEETDEVGSDSPYFLLFVGRPGNKPTSKVTRIRRDAWDGEIDSGDRRVLNQNVANDVGKSTLVLVALMEEDADPDVGTVGTIVLQSRMQEAFKGIGSVGGIMPAQMESLMVNEFTKAIDSVASNDELISIRRVNINTLSGPLPVLDFKGDGGHYRVHFVMA